MAASTTHVVVAVLVALQSLTATSDFLSPFISPIFDSVCKQQVDICGKGNCKHSDNNTFSFECDCDPGWKQSRSQNDENFKFLPCIIPNCTINQSCAKVPSSLQSKHANDSIFDPCHWTDCGGGSCNKTSAFSYSCQCDAGYNNLLNMSSLPCYKDCSFGLDCSNLGIAMTNQSTSATPAVGGSDQSEGEVVVIQGRTLWLGMVMGMVMSL